MRSNDIQYERVYRCENGRAKADRIFARKRANRWCASQFLQIYRVKLIEMATETDRKDSGRLVLFSLGGIAIGLCIAGLIALLVSYVADTDDCEDWRATDDCVVVYFHLSGDATWPDGTPMTADDVVFSYTTALLNADTSHGLSPGLDLPDDVGLICEKVDERIVRFVISASSRPQLVAMGFDIMPKSKLAEYIYTLNPEVPAGSFSEIPTLD